MKRIVKNREILTIVVPCYNEEEVLPETVKELGGLLENLIVEQNVAAQSKILFVDDGSKDQTWSLIQKFEKKHN